MKLKQLLLCLSLVLMTTSLACAGKVVTYESSMGNVEFDHSMHMQKVENSCQNTACHGDNKPGPIDINKEIAHGKMCKTCHAETAGPTGCKECHQK